MGHQLSVGIFMVYGQRIQMNYFADHKAFKYPLYLSYFPYFLGNVLKYSFHLLVFTYFYQSIVVLVVLA